MMWRVFKMSSSSSCLVEKCLEGQPAHNTGSEQRTIQPKSLFPADGLERMQEQRKYVQLFLGNISQPPVTSDIGASWTSLLHRLTHSFFVFIKQSFTSNQYSCFLCGNGKWTTVSYPLFSAIYFFTYLNHTIPSAVNFPDQ